MKKSIFYTSLLVLGVATILGSCTKSSTSTVSTATCSALDTKWSTSVKALANSYCVSCHSNYGTVSGISSNLSSIQSQISSGSMPKGSSLTTNQKNQFLCWLQDGAPNN